MFEVIHNELKCKGTSFRKKLRHDYPSIDLNNDDNLAKKVVILNNGPSIYNSSESMVITNFRKLFILNILSCCDNKENASKNWKIIESLDSENTFKIYYKLSKIIDLTMSL